MYVKKEVIITLRKFGSTRLHNLNLVYITVLRTLVLQNIDWIDADSSSAEGRKEQKNFQSFIAQNSIVLYLPLWWIFIDKIAIYSIA
jgi:hypothetical protein